MSKYGIVVIGYNRIYSIKRLINSLVMAQYDEDVDLIISIDNSEDNSVEEYSRSINWPFGKMIIKTFPERLGLKKHVLTCGNYINEFGFDAIIVLEDDLFVSPNFYSFAKQAVKRYESDSKIAGISLYSHLWNINADRPFIPIHNEFDVFYMQYPQSWGQVWMKEQWNSFYEWYKEKKYENIDKRKVPENVLKWPETSWLKYHVEYCIDQNKYFVYPYISLTTNFADAGTHYAYNTNKMQIPLNLCDNKIYMFPTENDEVSIYDAFFENEQLAKILNIPDEQLEVDLYGMKKTYKSKYVLTTKLLKKKVINSYGLQMRPWELNIVYNVQGDDIFLYDLTKEDKIYKKRHLSLIHWVYDTRGEVIAKRNFIDIIFNEVINKIKGK